ncbi:MAG: glycosyltransferase [Candidatus Odinarchaeia archaeon]
MRVSVIVPVYNEAKIIPKLVNILVTRFNELGMKHNDYEILFANDGSTDQTPKILEEYASKTPSIKHLNFKHNGKGSAIKKALSKAKGEIIAILDGDLEVRLAKPKHIKYYLNILKDKVDILVGSKWHPGTIKEICSLRKILSIAFNKLVWFFTGLKVKDTQTGLKIFNRKVVKKIAPLLTLNGFSFDVEFLSIAHLFKFKIREIPIKIKLKKAFKITEILKMFLDLIKIFYKTKITKLYQKIIAKNR